METVIGILVVLRLNFIGTNDVQYELINGQWYSIVFLNIFKIICNYYF